jgi:hypothetical protein
MTTRGRALVLSLLVLFAVTTAGAAAAPAVLLGACYCRAAGSLLCTGDLTEAECRRRCDEALCDDWFWKERLACWNWGYGG